MEKIAFQIEENDNVATALSELEPGQVEIRGAGGKNMKAIERIPEGHKIAVKAIEHGQDIMKYGVPIGRATASISEGSWVHLHCMESKYDERSSHLDLLTGAPKDIEYV
ncbi:MAG TPA: UxaA family hydrolase [Candidatus Pelethocola excrementipullorum]|nr:UxaA family hydrolase [Candidatus Pelethocola excrementipullorum]